MQASRNRIAKNTIMLYGRMLITMCISLYTSRAILSILGITDFGIYNVVGGMVSLIGFINGSLAGASTRFITYSTGKEDETDQSRTFSTLIIIHRIIAIILVVVIEIVGIWFLYNKLNIPVERLSAAFWVLQCSILTMSVSLISVPYNSLIIAYERMDVFAVISVCEAVAKLGVVYMLLLFKDMDRLIVYAVLIAMVQILVRITYGWFCHSHFPVARSRGIFDKRLLKNIFAFIGWKINGDIAFLGCTQGINIVLNLFFGPVVNAARGISVQVQNLANTFIQNYQMALQPQIIKAYAADDLPYMRGLIVACSKYGFYLMLLIAFPVLNYTNPILVLWLKQVPEHTVFLVQIILLVCFISPLRQPLIHAINATGKIKKFQIIEGSSLLLAVPVVYIELKIFHLSLEMAMISYMIIEYITQILRILIVLPYVNMSYKNYLTSILLPIFKVILILIFFRLIIINVVNGCSIMSTIAGVAISDIVCLVVCFLVGMDKTERHKMIMLLKSKLKMV